MGYNGYANYETWNVCLWISNDEGLYNLAQDCDNYSDFVNHIRDCGMTETPDNIAWNDSGIDHHEVNNACFPTVKD